MHRWIGVLIAETLLEDVDDLSDVVFQHGHLADELDYIGLEVGWQYLNGLLQNLSICSIASRLSMSPLTILK